MMLKMPKMPYLFCHSFFSTSFERLLSGYGRPKVNDKVIGEQDEVNGNEIQDLK